MQDRVQKHLRLQQIDMEEEREQLEEGDKPIELKKETIGQLHYDKEDLIQFHELMLQKPLVKACSELDYDHPTII
jgi:hypothetical protein